jgi:hypothetical protein
VKEKKQIIQPRPFSTEPADAIVKKMMELGWAYTRENYLALAFLGNPPAEPLDPEIEFDLPSDLQKSPPEEFDE